MKKHKLHYSTLLLLVLLVFCYIYRTDIVTYVMTKISDHTIVAAPNSNNYKNDYSFKFVHDTTNFHVKNRAEILDVFYTVLNSGEENFTFFCSDEYKSCESDIKEIAADQLLLSVINNMVSPYNSYKKLYVTVNSYGKANIDMERLYSAEDINIINAKIDDIKKEIIKDGMSDREKIKAFHDYIINNSVYDEERAANIEKNADDNPLHTSHKATGPLLEGWGLCSGYSDALKIYLDQLKIPNYKVANDKHIWNLVYIDGKWLNIDLTWDDPVTSDHRDLLLDKFFLITTDELLELDRSNHVFNSDYYPEMQ